MLELLTELLKITLGDREMDLQLVRAGLASDHARCQDAAVDLAAGHLVAFAPDLLRLARIDARRRVRLLTMLRADPLLALESRAPGRIGELAIEAAQPRVQAWFEPSRVAAILEACGDGAWLMAEDARPVAEQLPGLAQLLAWSPCSMAASEHRQRWAERERGRVAGRYPAQIAVAPSYRCDRKCEYCFTRSLMDRAPEMSITQFRSVLDAAGSAVTRVNLFGGEPTSFAALPDFIQELERRGLQFYFSTMAVCEPGHFAQLVSSPRLEAVTLHIDERSAYSEDEYRMVLDNARLLASKRLQTIVRTNLTDPANRDYSTLQDVLGVLPSAYLSFAVTFPSAGKDNRHAGLEALEGFGPAIVALVRWLERAVPGLPRAVLCKPFPLCAFGDETLAWLLSRVDYHNICEVDRNEYTDQVMVHPGLEATPCMALTAAGFRVQGLRTLPAYGAIFAERMRGVMGAPMKPKCATCILWKAGVCQTACYSYAQ